MDVAQVEGLIGPVGLGDGEQDGEVEGARDDDDVEDTVVSEVGLEGGADVERWRMEPSGRSRRAPARG